MPLELWEDRVDVVGEVDSVRSDPAIDVFRAWSPRNLMRGILVVVRKEDGERSWYGLAGEACW